jgi:tRNA dimethylallyltransferase
VGETASGKSSLALRLAEKFKGEIVCADSWTVRREVDIGTAKPSAEDRQQIPHHLLNIVAPCEDFSAAAFKQLANQAIADISSRGKVPILAGGSGLYVDSVLFDYTFLPAPSKQQRDELNALSIEQLLARIKQQGFSLEGVDVRNKRRLIRVLESGGMQPAQKTLRPNTLVLGVTWPRDTLKQRISDRVDQMFDNGLEREVKLLAEQYGWECEALKGIGYRQWREYFDGVQDLAQTKQRIIKDSLDLAKRQRTWFRRNKRINWICNFDESVDLVTTFLHK